MNVGLPGRTDVSPVRAVALAGLAGCVFFLSLTCVSLVTIDRLKYAIKAAGQPITPDFLLHLARPVDALFLGLTGLSLAVLLLAEWREHAFQALIGGRSPIWLLAFATAALVWFGHAILGPGLINLGDAGTHVARVNHLAMAIRDGASLYWDNYFFGGSTLLQFTGPFFHWTAALVQLVVGDPTQAVKYTTFFDRLVAAAFMYGFARRLGLSRSIAVITMMFYAGSFFVTYMEIIRASFPQLVNFAAMPAILYFIEGIFLAPAAFTVASTGLALSAIVFVACHQPTAAMFALFVAIYTGVRLAMTGWPAGAIKGLIFGAIAAGLGSVYFLVPFALERSATADNFSAGSLITLGWPAMATFRTIFVWGRAGTGAEYSAYFGLPMLLCVAAGIWLYATRPAIRRDAAMFLLCLGLALLTLFVRGAYVRHVTLMFFFLCATAGLGLRMLTLTLPRASWLPALVFVLVFIDAGPAAIQPWTRQDLRFWEVTGQELAAAAPDQRVVEITFNDRKPAVSVDPTLNVIAIARIQILNGPHKQDATPAHNAFAAMLKVAEHDLLADSAVTASTESMLGSVNVGWFVGAWGGQPGLPDWIKGTQAEPPFGRVLRLPHPTPVLASGRLEVMDRPAAFNVAPFWDGSFRENQPATVDAVRAVTDIASRMDVDLAARTAARILVPRIPDTAEWRIGGDVAPHIELRRYEVTAGTVHAVIEADRAGFIRLAHPLTPYTRVTRGGAIVAAIPDVESLAVLPVVPGTNDITMEWLPSPLRQATFWTSMMVGLALLASLVAMGSRSRRKARV